MNERRNLRWIKSFSYRIYTRIYLALTISVTRLSLTINSVGISVPLETRAIILAKFQTYIVVLNFCCIFALPIKYNHDKSIRRK